MHKQFMPNVKMSTDEQCRVVMKFEEKRQLLQAIRDRKDQLFGPIAAKMKPNAKQQLWEDVISTFKRACPDTTADLSPGYVRGIFWQNLRKRTLAKRERSQTDQAVKFDELDELVTEILGDKAISTSPHSRNHTPMTNISELFPFLNETLYNQLNNGALQFSNDDNDDNESPHTNLSTDEWRMDAQTETPQKPHREVADVPADSSLAPPSFKKRKYSQLGLAKLAQIEAQTARIRAETKLLELKYVCECKRYGMKPEKLGDGRQAFIIIEDSDAPVSTTIESENATVSDDEM